MPQACAQHPHPRLTELESSWQCAHGHWSVRHTMTPHGRASEWIRWAKSLATLRSLFVSRRWIIVYCLANISSKHACTSAAEGASAGYAHNDLPTVMQSRVAARATPEPLRKEAVEAQIRALLRAALDDHRGDFTLLPVSQLELHQFVSALIDSSGGHNGQIDGPPKVDEVLLRHVRDHSARAAEASLAGKASASLLLPFLLVGLVVALAARLALALAKHFTAQLHVGLLILLKVGIERKVIQALL
eukprot:scaffold51671_cov26-Tisochrysis_lutea.AAC.4